ncbi:hypothetical protein, variant [Verruconis gallopava]|uniref:histidine--tRNA ligase n=1 Tax=Verruconis gallopava TaxID=253628 RepID=A0A0D1XQW9_9PEZI|nr:uncharacterized protein PV09_04202 [Verruconis gallopava]XP_016214916.1 hypothetical protein, variant [Verruconis gallopava]KIW05046.1 hypothetical protein PV09_04202 [Verruconis gallopava]KIW05047.1 hypothetical protein, variant [Verruconis gallopava]
MPRAIQTANALIRFFGCRQRPFPNQLPLGFGDIQTQQYFSGLHSKRPSSTTALDPIFTDRFATASARHTHSRRISSTPQRTRHLKQGSVASNKDDMARKDKKEANNVSVKVPKGTKDVFGAEALLRAFLFQRITEIFKRHGAQELDTPVFELREILTGKYGEDSKLIYDLADQGGEICSLRYDLTVPFARWLALNSSLGNVKRYHVGKVYRRDAPAIQKGRLREFYQCDIDFAGQFDPLTADAEILAITKEVFNSIGLKDISVKINNRKILDAIFEVCGVPEEKIRPISSAVDKLDKSPWEEVKKEMVEQKGLDPEVADRIWGYVQRKGFEVLDWLQNDLLYQNAKGKEGVEDMKLLFEYCDAFGCKDALSFDLSLARGLDYYTGCIWEVVTAESAAPALSSGAETNGAVKKERSKKDKKASEDEDRSDDPTVGVGSIAAGGRYDKLVGMFSNKGDIPCVGISFGIERILAILKKRLEASSSSAAQIRPVETDCYVMAFGTGMLPERMAIAKQLWDAGLKASFQYKVKTRLDKQFKEAENLGAPFSIILAEEEWARGEVKLKQMSLPEGHPEKEGINLPKDTVVQELKKRLAAIEDRSLAARLGAVTL